MDTKRARTFLFWLFLGMAIALGILAVTSQVAGCEAADKPVADINAVASGAHELLNSPAGQLLPADIRLYSSLAITALMAGTAAYKQWRLTQMGKTTKAIVRGIEATQPWQTEAGATVNPAGNVKTNIAIEMRKLKIFDVANDLVDRLKAS